MTLTWIFFSSFANFVSHHVLLFFSLVEKYFFFFNNVTQRSNSLWQSDAFWPSWNGTSNSVGFSAIPFCKPWFSTMENTQQGWGSPWLHKDPWFSDFLKTFFLFTIGLVILNSVFVVKSKWNNIIKVPGPEWMFGKWPPPPAPSNQDRIAAAGEGSIYPNKIRSWGRELFLPVMC